MSTKEAAKYLNVSERTIHRLLARKAIQAEKFGNSWMIDRASLDEYQEKVKDKSRFDPTRGRIQ